MHFVIVFSVAVALAAAAPKPVSNIFEIDLSPEEAQKYLNSPPFTEPQLSGRTAVLPLVRYDDPRFRSVEAGPTLGHYWRNGQEIQNTEDYVEEVYDASQYHGQDGLGAYVYGYQTPESAKTENRQGSGQVQGTYTYQAPNHELVKVRYWADSQGFHQEDNLPKVQLQPVQETEAVRQARLAHEKAWKEAADANLHPNAHNDYSKYQADYQAAASEPEAVLSVAAAPSPQREAKAYLGQGNYQNEYTTTTTEEPTGPPRGFFYSYNYPVSIIVPKNAVEAGALHPGVPVDADTVGVNAQRP